MPKKKKKRAKTSPAAHRPVRQGRRVIKGKRIKVIKPEAVLEREIAEEDQDLRKAKVAEILEGLRKDREKRRKELERFMTDLRRQRIKRRGDVKKFMQDFRQQVLEKKKMMPEVRV